MEEIHKRSLDVSMASDRHGKQKVFSDYKQNDIAEQPFYGNPY